MKLLILLFFLLLYSCIYNTEFNDNKKWDYLMFVQFWPGTWIYLNNTYSNIKFNNSHFNIHGIWPNFYNGSWPEYCSGVPPFNTSVISSIQYELDKYWTNYKNTTEFLNHEYTKHISCLLPNSSNIIEFYFKNELTAFTYGLYLRQKYDLYQLLFVHNIHPNNNHLYNFKLIQNIINDFYNYQTVITCVEDIRDNIWYLDEIRFCFKPYKDELISIDCTSYDLNSSCPSEYIKYNYI